MKVETALEHIKVWLERRNTVQIIINKQPGAVNVVDSIDKKDHYRKEDELKTS